MKKLGISVVMMMVSILSYSQNVLGEWKTIDDNTQKARSIVEIFKSGDQYYGKILRLIIEPGDDPNPVCDACDEDDDRYMQKVIGMEVIRGMDWNEEDGELNGGEILDPENGNIYDCKIWVDEKGILNVRGYLYFFYRTQIWYPINE